MVMSALAALVPKPNVLEKKNEAASALPGVSPDATQLHQVGTCFTNLLSWGLRRNESGDTKMCCIFKLH